MDSASQQPKAAMDQFEAREKLTRVIRQDGIADIFGQKSVLNALLELETKCVSPELRRMVTGAVKDIRHLMEAKQDKTIEARREAARRHLASIELHPIKMPSI